MLRFHFFYVLVSFGRKIDTSGLSVLVCGYFVRVPPPHTTKKQGYIKRFAPLFFVVFLSPLLLMPLLAFKRGYTHGWRLVSVLSAFIFFFVQPFAARVCVDTSQRRAGGRAALPFASPCPDLFL